MLTTIKPKKKTLILYLLVPVLMFVFTVFVPLVTALVYSFFEWKGGPMKTFNGLANYKQLIHDHNILAVIWTQYLSGNRVYHRTDRYRIYPCPYGKCQIYQIKRHPSYLRIFPEYDRSSLYRSDLEYDLP